MLLGLMLGLLYWISMTIVLINASINLLDAQISELHIWCWLKDIRSVAVSYLKGIVRVKGHLFFFQRALELWPSLSQLGGNYFDSHLCSVSLKILQSQCQTVAEVQVSKNHNVQNSVTANITVSFTPRLFNATSVKPEAAGLYKGQFQPVFAVLKCFLYAYK
ncbi:hypothetical protein ARMGADRAFT_1037401 [Armillaria gallica]|uniref:Uncharacterized protein n=1 Tax=Armillaria gallica TaxID=47427 RepID=A0A2H3D4R1_ARMGA|nr:hypothetical protein ARMGADRAFT_1037401 [Armillaria gallica]